MLLVIAHCLMNHTVQVRDLHIIARMTTSLTPFAGASFDALVLGAQKVGAPGVV